LKKGNIISQRLSREYEMAELRRAEEIIFLIDAVKKFARSALGEQTKALVTISVV